MSPYLSILQIKRDKSTRGNDNHHIDYLHRTVRDFLRTDEIIQYLKLHAKGFNPSKIFGRGRLAIIKTRKWTIGDLTHSGHFQITLSDALNYVKETEIMTGMTDHEMLDELWRTVDHFSKENQCSILWYNHGSTPVHPCQTFPNFAIQKGLTLYVDYLTKHKSRWLSSANTQPFLYIALMHPTIEITSTQTENTTDASEIVHILLAGGADPNEPYNGSSPWGYFFFSMSVPNKLASCAETHRRRHMVAKILLGHGADPNQTFCKTSLRNRHLQFCHEHPASSELNRLRLTTIHMFLDFGADRAQYLKYSETLTSFLLPDRECLGSRALDVTHEAFMTRYGTIALPQVDQEPNARKRQQQRRCCGLVLW